MSVPNLALQAMRRVMSDTSGFRTKGLCSRDMVLSYPALSPPFRHFREEHPPKWRNGGDGSEMRLERWRENSKKANMRLILFPRTTILSSVQRSTLAV